MCNVAGGDTDIRVILLDLLPDYSGLCSLVPLLNPDLNRMQVNWWELNPSPVNMTERNGRSLDTVHLYLNSGATTVGNKIR